MSIKIYIHKSHRQFTDGFSVVDSNGKTVGECLDNLIKKYPGIKEILFDKRDNLLNVIEIYVNLESAYPNELIKKVSNGDEIYLTAKLAGG